MSTVVDEMVIKWSIDDTNYTKGLNSIDKKMKLVKSEFGATDSQLQAFGSTIDKLKNKQEYLTKTLTLQENKCKSLKEAYEKTKKETGENSEASQKLATKLNNAVKYYNKLENELKQTTNKLQEEEKQLKKSESAWEKISKAAEQANEKISKSIEKIKGTAAKIGGAFAGVTGISAAFANNFEKSMNKFQASIGASSEEMESFKEVAKTVYADNFGESFEDVADSVQVVNKYLNLTGDDLKNITKLALGFRDSFGVDTNESIRSCKALMDNFGVSAEEAFNLLVQGEQRGLDYSGELIDNVNEYSVQFGKLGLSAEDMFNIFESGANAGAFNLDKIGDAVKEFSIRAIDGSNTTIDGFTKLGLNVDDMASKFAKGGDSAKSAFYQVIEGIRNMNDPVQQSIVGVDLFGTMWEDLGPQVVTSLDSIKDGFDKTKESANELNNVQYNNFGDGLKGMWREIQVSCLTPLESELMPKFNEIAQKVRDKMPEIKDIIGNTMSKIASAIGFLVDNINIILPIAKSAIAVFLGFKVISSVNSTIKTVNESISNLKKGMEAIKTFKGFSNLKGHFLTLATSAKTLATNIAHVTVNLAKSAAQFVVTTAKMAIHKAGMLASAIATNTLKIAQAALNLVMSLNPITLVIIAVTGLIAVIVTLYNKCDWFRNGVNLILKDIESFFINLGNKIYQLWNAAIDFCSNKISVFQSFVKNIISSINGIWNYGCNGIRSIWDGLVGGIKSAFQTIVSPIQAVVSSISSIFSSLRNRIKLPHFHISGSFSLDPPSIPHIGVDWYWKGGIFKSPTILGGIGVGDRYNGMGSNSEAVIPLDTMYSKLRDIVKQESNQTDSGVYIIQNVLDGNVISEDVYRKVEGKLVRSSRRG